MTEKTSGGRAEGNKLNMTSQELHAELETEMMEEREAEGIDLADLPGQDDEIGEKEVVEADTD